MFPASIHVYHPQHDTPSQQREHNTLGKRKLQKLQNYNCINRKIISRLFLLYMKIIFIFYLLYFYPQVRILLKHTDTQKKVRRIILKILFLMILAKTKRTAEQYINNIIRT